MMPEVAKRIAAVKQFRVQSKRAQTRKLAETPANFLVTVVPKKPFLVIPEVSSERREYIPIGWLEPPTIPSNLVRVLLDADVWHFGILTSHIHMAWLRLIGGRLESRYRYSVGIVYNPFPWPDATPTQQSKIRSLADAILKTRDKFPGASLADLYDSDLMKPELRRAHQSLDVAVDKLYRPMPFSSDRERVEHLFARYEKLIAPLTTIPQPRRGKRAPRL